MCANTGEAATHAIVFAQLIMPDGKNEGLHGFMTPVRNPDTFLPFPGVIIGDMGEKIGCNGMDNGSVNFYDICYILMYCLVVGLELNGSMREEGKPPVGLCQSFTCSGYQGYSKY